MVIFFVAFPSDYVYSTFDRQKQISLNGLHIQAVEAGNHVHHYLPRHHTFFLWWIEPPGINRKRPRIVHNLTSSKSTAKWPCTQFEIEINHSFTTISSYNSRSIPFHSIRLDCWGHQTKTLEVFTVNSESSAHFCYVVAADIKNHQFW